MGTTIKFSTIVKIVNYLQKKYGRKRAQKQSPSKVLLEIPVHVENSQFLVKSDKKPVIRNQYFQRKPFKLEHTQNERKFMESHLQIC